MLIVLKILIYFLRSAGFYNPTVTPQFDRDQTGNPADPPHDISLSVGEDNPLPSNTIKDSSIINASTFPEMRQQLEAIHNNAHSHLGGTLTNAHISFRHLIVFMLHSNVDRLFA